MEKSNNLKRQQIVNVIMAEQAADTFGKAPRVALGVTALIGLAGLATCYLMSPEMVLDKIDKVASYFGVAFGGSALNTIVLGFFENRFVKKAEGMREDLLGVADLEHDISDVEKSMGLSENSRGGK